MQVWRKFEFAMHPHPGRHRDATARATTKAQGKRETHAITVVSGPTVLKQLSLGNDWQMVQTGQMMNTEAQPGLEKPNAQPCSYDPVGSVEPMQRPPNVMIFAERCISTANRPVAFTDRPLAHRPFDGSPQSERSGRLRRRSMGSAESNLHVKQQDAYRRGPPGRDPRCHGAWQSGR